MSLSTCLSGGCVRDSWYMVKMYWLDTASEDTSRPSVGAGAADSCPCGHSRNRLVWAINKGMRPLIGVTTSELRPSGAGTLRRHGEPPHAEMALGMTYLRAIEAAGGMPVVLPPLGDPRAAASTASTASACRAGRTSIPASTAPPSATRSSARPSRRSTRSSWRWLAPPTRTGCRYSAICRGAQALNVARGGTLHQHLPGHRQTEPATATTHSVHVEPESRLAQLVGTDALRVNSFHHQAVVGSAATCAPSRTRPTGPSRRSRPAARASWWACSGTPKASSPSRATARCSTLWWRRRSAARRSARRRTSTAALGSARGSFVKFRTRPDAVSHETPPDQEFRASQRSDPLRIARNCPGPAFPTQRS